MTPYEVSGSLECWTVSALDVFTGQSVATVFLGPTAEERARTYADWMNAPLESAQQLFAIRKELQDIGSAIHNLRRITAKDDA